LVHLLLKMPTTARAPNLGRQVGGGSPCRSVEFRRSMLLIPPPFFAEGAVGNFCTRKFGVSATRKLAERDLFAPHFSSVAPQSINL
jgi:hypothetical protein